MRTNRFGSRVAILNMGSYGNRIERSQEGEWTAEGQ